MSKKKIEDEGTMRVDEFLELTTEPTIGKKVDWTTVLEENKRKIISQVDFIRDIKERYDCSEGAVRRKMYQLRDKGMIEIRYIKKGNRSLGVIRFLEDKQD